MRWILFFIALNGWHIKDVPTPMTVKWEFPSWWDIYHDSRPGVNRDIN